VADFGGPAYLVAGNRELATNLGPLFKKLRPGPGHSADDVLSNQRRRIHRAMIALVDGGGWERVRVRALVQTAGVSTATFYSHFSNTDECLASAFDEAIADAVYRSAAAQGQSGHWHDSLRASVSELMDVFAREPQVARVALIDVFSAGAGTRQRIGFAIRELERLVAASFEAAPRQVAAPRHLIAGMAAGMVRMARKTTLAGRGDELPGLADELCGWMVSMPHPEIVSLLNPAGGRQDRRETRPLPDGRVEVADPIYGDRGRLLQATLRLAAAQGFTGLSAPGVRSEAGVSRLRFDTQFSDLDSCFLAAVEMTIKGAAARAVAWSSDAGDWATRTCRTVQALCAQGARDRRGARVAFLEIVGPGRPGLLCREQLVSEAAEALRATIPAEVRPSELTVEASVAAAWHIAQADIAAGRTRQLPRIAPLLSYVLLAPVIGPSAAAATVRRAG
jgi:AcrR family transcriptional regulator